MKILNSKPLNEIFTSEKKILSKRQNPKEKTNSQKIIIDYREKNSPIPSQLVKFGLDTQIKELKVGDYIIGNVVIERKTISDFLSSMINKRLLRQIEDLKQFEKRLLIIEGMEEQEIYKDKDYGINPNAIRGFLLSITLKHNIPIIFTKNSEDTSKFIQLIANKKEKQMPLNGKKKALDKKEQLQFVLESFPGIGPKTAQKLLEKFGTIQNIINAPEESLKEILGKKTQTFLEIIGEKY